MLLFVFLVFYLFLSLYGSSKISQERLSGLVILSIEKKMLKKFDYKSLINNFESKRVRKIKMYN
jgi:hypothetical protein